MNHPFSQRVLGKSRELIRKGRVRRDPDAADLFWVKGSGDTPYRVQIVLDGSKVRAASCTCHFGKYTPVRVSKCSHVGAGLLIILEERNG